jgi:hypothetical protein
MIADAMERRINVILVKKDVGTRMRDPKIPNVAPVPCLRCGVVSGRHVISGVGVHVIIQGTRVVL